MPTPSTALQRFLEQTPLPWLKWSAERQKFIMVVDNHLMSTYRACPQHFIYAHVDGLRNKGLAGEAAQRVWFLEFGVVLHEALETYYLNFRRPDFDMIAFCTYQAASLWAEHKMDAFCEHKEYKLIGGLHGFVGLLIQYATILSPENEKLRVLGTEVSFGKNYEVILCADEYFEMYLSGRMDIIVDDGYFICPMDHKSMARFTGDPAKRFMVDDGPTGYIYALKTVLPSFIPADMILKRDCSKILMNLISKTPTSTPQDRFKRIQLRKTEWELEQYRLRMVATGKHLLEDMEHVAQGLEVYRNTHVCQNWMRYECSYFDVCRQQSKEGALITIQNGFTRVKLWDTENMAVTTE